VQIFFSAVIDLALKNSPRVKIAEDDAKEALDQSITELLPLITAEDARGWFRNCMNSL
jgi:hypothetical protein